MNRPLEISINNLLAILAQYSRITLEGKTMISIDDIEHFLNKFSKVVIYHDNNTDEEYKN